MSVHDVSSRVSRALAIVATLCTLAMVGCNSGGDDSGHDHGSHSHGDVQSGGHSHGGAQSKGTHSHGDAQNGGHSHGGDVTSPDTNPMGNPRRTMTSNGEFFVTYGPEPAPIPLNEIFKIEVSVYDTDEMETPVEGASIEVEARMPKHGHGMNTDPVIEKESNGVYIADGLKFHMPGTPEAKWVITVTVETSDTSDEARFEVVTANR
jgi:hypothetical protein